MAILSNKGRVIESLANYASPSSGDLLVIQDVKNNQTKNITLTQLSQKLATVIQDVTVDFTSENNKFTGSFKGGTFTGSSADFATSLRLIGGKAFIDKNNFQALSFTNMKFGTTGAPIQFLSTIFTDQDIEANIITANSDVVVGGVVYGALEGSVHGNLTGDVYSEAGNKVLENSANLAKNALFYGTASYAKTASVASYAKVAEVTLTCVTHATDADFATYGLSSSYASQSRSSSYLRYHPILNPKNGTASYAIKSNASDYATTSNTSTSTTFLTYTGVYNGSASYALSGGYIRSASYARSSSYVNSASYALSSSYGKRSLSSSYARSGSYATYAALAGTFASAYSEQSNFNLSIVNPTGAITYKQYLFYNQFSDGNSYQNLMRIDQRTGEVKKLNRSLLNGGRMSLFNFDYNPTSPGIGEGGQQDRIVYGANSNIVIVSNLLGTTPVVRILPVSNGGGWRQHRCVHIDTTVSGNQSDVTPTFYMLGCDTTTTFNQIDDLYKVYFDGSNYVYVAVSGTGPSFTYPNLDYSTNTYANNIVNYSDFTAIETKLTNGIWSYNYNPVKYRLYIMGYTTGLVNIFKLNATAIGAGITNIVDWWKLPVNTGPAATTKYSYLTYEKSVIIPTGYPYNNFREVTDWGALEYDTTTGQEKFWCANKYGIDNVWPGVISKAAYWES